MTDVNNGDPKKALGSKKPDLSLIPASAKIEVAKALAFGAYTKKYGPYNWRKGYFSVNLSFSDCSAKLDKTLLIRLFRLLLSFLASTFSFFINSGSSLIVVGCILLTPN